MRINGAGRNGNEREEQRRKRMGWGDWSGKDWQWMGNMERNSKTRKGMRRTGGRERNERERGGKEGKGSKE